MSAHSINIDKTGTYFFKNEVVVSSHLNKELLVIFYIKNYKTTGVLYFNPITQPVRSLHEMLDSVYETLKKEKTLEYAEMKVFGMSVADERALACLYQWVKSKKIEIISEDIGRNTNRLVHVDCLTGRVGIQYAESAPLQKIKFFMGGSFKDRSGYKPSKKKIPAKSKNSSNVLKLKFPKKTSKSGPKKPLKPLKKLAR